MRLAVLLSVLTYVSAFHLRHGDAPISSDNPSSENSYDGMACFISLSHVGLQVNKSDIMFQQASDAQNPEVMVMQDLYDGEETTKSVVRRTLVFKDSRGACNCQAAVVCHSVEDLSIAAPGLLDDECSSAQCKVDAALTTQLPGSGYVRSMASALHLLSSDRKDRKVLSIGLGAGQLPMAIQQVMPGAQQTVVELSQSVIDAAPCFGVGADGTNYDIVHAEGRGYLEAANDMAYDAVLVDVADGSDRLPACFSTIEFFKTVRRVLKPKGVLAMNVHTGHTLHNDLTDLLPGALQVFGEVKVGHAPGLANAIVLVQTDGNATIEGDGSADTRLQAWYDDAEFIDAANSTSKGAAQTNARTDLQNQC